VNYLSFNHADGRINAHSIKQAYSGSTDTNNPVVEGNIESSIQCYTSLYMLQLKNNRVFICSFKIHWKQIFNDIIHISTSYPNRNTKDHLHKCVSSRLFCSRFS